MLVFFAAAFFLKLAMDQMGPVGKVLVGILVGMGFLVTGEVSERRAYSPLARALTGGGLMILYLTIFASFSYFELIDQIPAFLVMALITGAGVTLSVRYDSQVILILALLGGFLTPVMVSTGKDNQVGLMSYMLLLDSALIGVAYWRRWRGITLLCFTATIILFSGWAAKFYGEEKFVPTFLFATAFFLVFGIADILHGLAQKVAAKVEDLLLISLNAVVYFAAMYVMIEDADNEVIYGGFAFALAIFYFLEVRVTMKMLPEDANAQRFLTGFAVAFLTMAIPLQLDYESVTVVWAAEGLALSAYGLYSRNELIRYGGLAVLLIAIGHLLIVDPEIYRKHLTNDEDFKLLLSVVVTYLSVLAAAGGAIYAYHRWQDRVALPANIFVGAYIFEIGLFLVFIMALNHYCFQSGVYPKGLYSSAGRGEVLNVSLILGIYASALIAAGILYRLKWLRYLGLPLLGFTLLKVVFYDLAGLPLSHRMISFLALGGLLIGLSFLYNKYKDRLEGMALSDTDKKAGE